MSKCQTGDVARLRAALKQIADSEIGSQPVELNMPEEQWARRCHAELRRIAREALQG